MSELHQTMTKLEEENRKFDIQRRQELREMKEHLIRSFKESSKLVSQDDGRKESELQACVRRSQQMLPVNQEDIRELCAMLRSLANDSLALESLAKTSEMNQRFLRSLHFSQLKTRHRKIPRAHRQTFEWIFEPPWPGKVPHCTFLDWLRYGNGFYWVQGKAGSGKSTLMKFICQEPRTAENLQKWAGHKNLVMANFFFWNPGSKLQKSQEGLLRSLLFEVLRNCPELIPQAAQATEHCYDREAEGWSAEELLSIFKAVLKDNTSTKFCFFIDGLDEYQDENRSCRDLLQTLSVLAESPNIKLCVSSRPWMIFADAFGENDNRFLKLEQLTQADIQRYVTDKFRGDAQFRKLEANNASFSDLIQEVVVRAQGVFLWVFLVVRDLLEGFTYHDTVATLRSRLLSFPPDLEQYFQHMMNSIPAFYRKETAHAFRIAITAPQPLLVVTYSFWDDVSRDPGFALLQPRVPMEKEEAMARQDRTRRQLDGRCRGLLEIVAEDQDVNDYCRYRVDFLHRTVRDFINESNQIEEMYNGCRSGDAKRPSDLDSNDNVELTLCHCLVATLKRFPKLLPSRSSERRYLDELIGILLKTASRAEDKSRCSKQGKQELITLLEQAEESFLQLVSQRGRCSPNDCSLFLGLACQCNAQGYVEYRLTHATKPFIPSVAPGPSLLRYALIGDGDELHRPPLSIVQLLLGANDETVSQLDWIEFLRRISRGEVGRDDPTSFELVRLLLNHGADPNIEVPAPVSNRSRYLAVSEGSKMIAPAQWAPDIIRKAFPDASILLGEVCNSSDRHGSPGKKLPNRRKSALHRPCSTDGEEAATPIIGPPPRYTGMDGSGQSNNQVLPSQNQQPAPRGRLRAWTRCLLCR